MRRLTPRHISAALLCVLVGAALLVADVSPEFALSAVPALALAAALIFGAFPGAELIDRLRERRSMPTRRRAAAAAPRLRPAAYVRPVGRAMAFALAMRPPPAVAARA